MRILYAIQGTGNGHVSRARDMIPALKQKGEVDLLISGHQCDVNLPYEIKYQFQGLCFVFGKKGGIDYFETYKKSSFKSFYKEVVQLPVEEYDLVISDFEPVSAWACFIKNKPCVGLSHQIGAISKQAPKPNKVDVIGKAILKYYAPASVTYGFHFLPYDKNIFTPVIREEIRRLDTYNNGHYTVYLPAYSDKKISKTLLCFPEVPWQVFSKHCKEAYQVEHISVYPVNNTCFLNSLAGAEGVLCGAGFETPAEVLYLQKKLMVIPMKGQYEQQCNAAALKALGVPVIKNLKQKQFRKIQEWLLDNTIIPLSCPNETESIIDFVIHENAKQKARVKVQDKAINSPSKLRELVLKKIFN